jgi:hypothetical protein
VDIIASNKSYRTPNQSKKREKSMPVEIGCRGQ